MIDPAFRYDAETHVYWLHGRRLPSVTEIIQHAGLISDAEPWWGEQHAERGSVAHFLCELDDRGQLDEAQATKLAPDKLGYLAAWRSFKNAMNFSAFDDIEKPRYSSLGFAGTPDRVIGSTVIDIKTGQSHPAIAIQLAAYAMLIRSQSVPPGPAKIMRRIAVRLFPDGRFTLYPIVPDYGSDFSVFLACLSLYNWKLSKGISK